MEELKSGLGKLEKVDLKTIWKKKMSLGSIGFSLCISSVCSLQTLS
jgi:hypothetical protein